MSKVYFIGGLGVDCSIVNDISLKNYSITFIDWLIPEIKDTFNTYSRKIISKYEIEPNSIIIAVSFGGLVAIEISKIVDLKQIILISSFSKSKELPFLFRLGIRLRLFVFFLPSILQYFSFALNYFFSISNPQDSMVLKKIIKDTNPTFFKWAVKNILNFTHPAKLPSLRRIHGNKDRILPSGKYSADIIISNGGHFMIYDKKKEVNTVLEKLFLS